ncbi:MAG: S-layer homology domain-containing protein [Candidatus Gracilibacteria bacterium]|jgi:hypothetical protein
MAYKNKNKIKKQDEPWWITFEKTFLKIEVVALILFLLAAAFYLRPYSAKIGSVHASADKLQALFSDVQSDYPYAQALSYFKVRGLAVADKDGAFHPDEVITRAELLKLVVLASNVQPTFVRYRGCFKDVKAEVFAPSVCYAKSKGIVQGYKDGTFKPLDPISVENALNLITKNFNANPAIGQEATTGLNSSENIKRGLMFELIYELSRHQDFKMQ